MKQRLMMILMMLGASVGFVLAGTERVAAQRCVVNFVPARNFDAGNSPQSVTTGDFNRDGKLDIATANANQYSNNVSVLLNTCGGLGGSPPNADSDNDGVPDICDVDSNPGAADVDRDGIVDSSACDTQIGPPVDANQCKNGGWQLFNIPRTFRNQGECIQFVNTRR